MLLVRVEGCCWLGWRGVGSEGGGVLVVRVKGCCW